MATPIAGPDPPAAGGEGGGPYIPAELIADIAKHLTSLNDIFALRAYRAALPLRRDLLAAQPPCLLVPHSSASPALPLFNLLEPGCPSFSLALFHLPQRRLHRFRARLPFARTGGVLTSDGTQVVAVDDATGEIIVTHLLSGAQVRLPKPPLPHDRLILTGGFLFAPAAGRTDVQFCNNPWKNRHWTVASYGGEHEILDWRIINGVLYGFLPTCGLVAPSLSKDNSSSMTLWLLGGEFDPQVMQAMQESTCPPLLGDCAGELLLIFKVGSVDPAYKIFRWDAIEGAWATATSLGGRTMFLGFDDFVACIGPDVPGIRGDCVYGSLPWAGGWSEYSIIDGTCKCFTAKYPGQPGVGFARPQVWVIPSLFCNRGSRAEEADLGELSLQ